MKKIALLLLILSTGYSFGQDCLDVKFKLKGYFYAGTSKIDTTAIGGFYEDDNRPKKIDSKINNISIQDTFQIIVKSDTPTEFENGISGFKVFVINKTDSIINLPAQDSRLYMKRQVFYKNEWKDIEYLPGSWCGNSYHSVSIKSNEFWEFKAPCIVGKITSKFRFVLDTDDDLPIYSNEFQGSFNRRQLKKEQGHKSLGLMDPYNN